MILRKISHGKTSWFLISKGNQYFLKISDGRSPYWFALEHDKRHERFHPKEADLMVLNTKDLAVLHELARSYLGEAPSGAIPNPVGQQGRLPLLVKRRAAVILKSMTKNQGSSPTRDQISIAIATAKKRLQADGYLKRGSDVLTAKGLRKQTEMTPEKQKEAERIFSAIERGRKVPARRNQGSRKSYKLPIRQRIKSFGKS